MKISHFSLLIRVRLGVKHFEFIVNGNGISKYPGSAWNETFRIFFIDNGMDEYPGSAWSEIFRIFLYWQMYE